MDLQINAETRANELAREVLKLQAENERKTKALEEVFRDIDWCLHAELKEKKQYNQLIKPELMAATSKITQALKGGE
jgi:hypothetical protein